MPAEPELLGETSLDGALGGRLRLRQPRRGHRFGHDGVLVAAATAADAGEHVVDLGSGVGIAGLAFAHRCPGIRVTLVDRDEALVALAAENIEANGLTDRVRAVPLDIAEGEDAFVARGLAPGTVGAVMMNPPFNPDTRFAPSPDPGRRRAHVAGESAPSAWVDAAERLLSRHGVLTAIWRADGLPNVLAALGGRFGEIAIVPVYPRPGTSAIRILVRAVKGSRGPLALCSGLLLNGADGHPTAEAEAVLRHAEPLRFG